MQDNDLMASQDNDLPVGYSHVRRRNIDKNAPPLIRFLRRQERESLYGMWTLVLTYICYTNYHITRKVISVVKSSLFTANCTLDHGPIRSNFLSAIGAEGNHTNTSHLYVPCPDWKPFGTSDGSQLLGVLDLLFLLFYAFGGIVSGYIAERVNKRYFLTISMLLVAVVTVALGLSYFLKIHSYAYFVVFQIADGLVQSNGLPILIACVASWYGKGRRGLVMGIWYSHTSVGNILGSIIPGIWASGAWGWSFVVPGILMAVFGIVTFFTLVTEPSEVDCREPKQNDEDEINRYRNSGERQRLLDDSTANSYVEEDNSGRLLHSRHRSINSVDTANMPDIHHNQSPPKVAIRFIDAIKIDSVAIFAFALFFNKLVSYTFIYWLPFYLDDIDINGVRYGSEKSAFLSVFFDLGGIIGSVSAGLIIDKTGCKAIICTVLLLLSVPSLFIYHYFGHISLAVNIVLMMLCGITVYGPSALIITTVSAELGNHPSLKSNQRATATVSSIINGTGGIGAAMGPLLTGYIVPTGWSHVFYMLMASEGASALLLFRSTTREISRLRKRGSSSGFEQDII